MRCSFTGIGFYTFFFTDAIAVLIASLITGCVLTMRKARKKGQSIWDTSAKRLIINLLIPLVSGGLFCLVLLYHGLVGLVAPATLIFYGLALLNASKYTLDDIRYLGICEIGLGLISSVYVGYGLTSYIYHIFEGFILKHFKIKFIYSILSVEFFSFKWNKSFALHFIKAQIIFTQVIRYTSRYCISSYTNKSAFRNHTINSVIVTALYQYCEFIINRNGYVQAKA